jgi:hypothetical protein
VSALIYIVVESFWDGEDIRGAFSTFDLAADAVATLVEAGRVNAGSIGIVAAPVDDLDTGESPVFAESAWDEIKKRLAHRPDVVERVNADMGI